MYVIVTLSVYRLTGSLQASLCCTNTENDAFICQGYEVVGVFMQNWDQTNETGVCTAALDRDDAVYTCDKLKIPLLEANFVKEYWNYVFRYTCG